VLAVSVTVTAGIVTAGVTVVVVAAMTVVVSVLFYNIQLYVVYVASISRRQLLTLEHTQILDISTQAYTH